MTIASKVKAMGDELDLPVVADLPFWANTIPCPGSDVTLDVWMLSTLDTANFMTYRNTPSELLSIATPALEAGVKTGKPVWLAVETVNTEEGDQVSYYGQTLSELLEDLDEIDTLASRYTSYAGIGIHYYSGVMALTS